MPHRPPHLCNHTGCPTLVPASHSRCPIHEAQALRAYNQSRAKTSERGYGGVWQKVRKIQLNEEPFCVQCGESAEHVHHVIPIGQGGDNSFENLQSLCASCHNSLSRKPKKA